MTDIALAWNNDLQCADIALDGLDLQQDGGLNTAIIISLFTDRRANPDDRLPDASANRRGWWGDAAATTPGALIGSRLWLLERSKITPETLRLAQEYAEEALAWLLADKVAASLTVTVERRQQDQIALLVQFIRPDGKAGQYDYVWKAYA
jgi:phage gp46-like protein